MFETLMFLLIPWLGFRLLGGLGLARFATWRISAAHALAVMLVLTGSAHFVPDSVTVMPSHGDLTAMVPPFVPFPDLMVYATGVFELLGALGLVLAATRSAAGICLATLFVLLLPANAYAAVESVPLNGDPATPLWFRIPEQILYITIALWATRPIRTATTERPVPYEPGGATVGRARST
ncbi:DoxX family protein [Microbispora sp. CA-102843]|uniref:DoxX family protein n=1 Tax=Microbispora sp. CA-102843 TaxID=3239952 RepID=UPI003D8E5F8A